MPRPAFRACSLLLLLQLIRVHATLGSASQARERIRSRAITKPYNVEINYEWGDLFGVPAVRLFKAAHRVLS